MDWITIIALILAIVLFIHLTISLLFPEKF
jgi:K+-transporting ATPase KdpF subunit